MKQIFLINKENIPHYRVAVYNYLSEYLKRYQYLLTVISEGVQEENQVIIKFRHIKTHLCFTNMSRLFRSIKPDVVIYWINFKLYKLPLLLFGKCLKIKTIYWGHGRDLQHPNALFKNCLYFIEHLINNAIILYSEKQRKYICKCFHTKTFTANNTLNMTEYGDIRLSKNDVKIKYGISTSKNIIYLGRIQKRKRIEDLIQAFGLLKSEDIGLILAGPDNKGILEDYDEPHLYRIGAVFGEESLDLLSASDVFCMPGAIGLSIVDAFICGLPIVTEAGNHGPEIMYLKDNVNGFVVPKGDIKQLAEKLRILLYDDKLRNRFSHAAKDTIMIDGHIDKLCEGFKNALQYVLNKEHSRN
jgi:glycosyltransferase involved in cell wall biosynthesis